MPTKPQARKWITVWVEKRKNPPKKNGKRTFSYTLEWDEFGQRKFLSLGRRATKGFADSMAKAKEVELNSSSPEEALKPITWADFKKKYLDTLYPGHELDAKQRRDQSSSWAKSEATFREDRRVLEVFSQIVKPEWCHDITTEDREKFIQKRLGNVGSPISVTKDLKILRHLFNVLAEWGHRPQGTNPFSGNGKATVGTRRKRAKELQRRENGMEKRKFYTRAEAKALLAQADKEVTEAPTNWEKQRLRALVYFEAFTGMRLKEVVFLEWSEIDYEMGIAWLNAKIVNHLKTAGSEAPVGLPDSLIAILRKWQEAATCKWVFPNRKNSKPWTSGSQGGKSLDQLKELAKRAEIHHATWQMFRHTLSTLGKSEFGLSEEQIKASLRHTTTETQKHYTHDDLVGLRTTANAINFKD